MLGLSAATGRAIDGDAHLMQSIRDILTTPIGTRVLRPEYGSRLPRLVDAPSSPATITAIYAAVAEALDRWEPRLRLTRCRLVEAGADGALVLALDGVRVADGRTVTIDRLAV